MRPQFFPWLFDDKSAWEKSFADPRYSYELPIDCFMSIYQIERKPDGSSVGQFTSSMLSMPVMPLPTSIAPLPAAPAQVFATAGQSAAPAAKEESKHEEGILSQDEIDALLSGL